MRSSLRTAAGATAHMLATARASRRASGAGPANSARRAAYRSDNVVCIQTAGLKKSGMALGRNLPPVILARALLDKAQRQIPERYISWLRPAPAAPDCLSRQDEPPAGTKLKIIFANDSARLQDRPSKIRAETGRKLQISAYTKGDVSISIVGATAYAAPGEVMILNAAEVLRRLKHAFRRLPVPWADEIERLGLQSAHIGGATVKIHSLIEVFEVDIDAGGLYGDRDDGGYQFRDIPSRNRKTNGLLAGPRGKYKRMSDEATAFIAERDKKGTGEQYDLDENIENMRRHHVRIVRRDPAHMTVLCEERAKLADIPATDRNSEIRAVEALCWLLDGAGDESAGRLTLQWLDSGLTQRAFAAKHGMHHNELRRQVAAFCESIAETCTATPVNERSYRNPDTLVRGFDRIAGMLGKTPSHVAREIGSGKYPVAMLNGEPVALREVISSKPRSSRRPATSDNAA